jgi:hypothetical protein
MSNTKEATKPAPSGASAASNAPPASMPAHLINLSEKYPRYNPGIDVRDRRNHGKKGVPLHGYLLGQLDMPATIVDPDTGEYKPWTALCIELISDCPGDFADDADPNKIETKMCHKGDRVIITKSTVIESADDRGLKAALEDVDHVYEIYIEPVAWHTKDGSKSLWKFPVLGICKKKDALARGDHQHVQLVSRSAPAKQLEPGNGRPAPSRVPFDQG